MKLLHVNGLTNWRTEIGLEHCQRAEETDEFWPLGVGTTWRYRWSNVLGQLHHDERWRVVRSDGHRAFLAIAGHVRQDAGANEPDVLRTNLTHREPGARVWSRIMLGPPEGADAIEFYRELVKDADAADHYEERFTSLLARVGLASVIEANRPDQAEPLWRLVSDAMADERRYSVHKSWIDLWMRSLEIVCRHKRFDRLAQIARRQWELLLTRPAEEHTPIVAAVVDMAVALRAEPDPRRIGAHSWGGGALTTTGSRIDLQEPGGIHHCDEISTSPRRFLCCYAFWGDPLMLLPVRQGRRWTGVCNTSDPGWARVHIAMRRQIMATDAIAEVPAGKFGPCVLVHASHALSTGLAGMPVRAGMKGWTTCTRREWWAPGVGMVLMECDHANGEHTRIEMTAHHILGKGKSLFPLRKGSRWEYQWLGADGRVFLREFWRVGHRMGKAVRLGQAAYGYLLDDMVAGPARPVRRTHPT